MKMTLKEARFKKDMTQADIFKITGIHIPKLSLIERGYMIPTEDERCKIATALECLVTEITY